VRRNENMALYMPAKWEKHEGTWLQWPHNGTSKGELVFAWKAEELK